MASASTSASAVCSSPSTLLRRSAMSMSMGVSTWTRLRHTSSFSAIARSPSHPLFKATPRSIISTASTRWNPSLISSLSVASALSMGTLLGIGARNVQEPCSCQCEGGALPIVVPVSESSPAPLILTSPSITMALIGARLRRAWRLFKRLVQLAFTLAPVVAFYPLLWLVYQRDPSEDAQVILLSQCDSAPITGVLGWYLRLCLNCVEHSGAAVIKLMQWAGSRPDLFGSDFCAVFSKLQDHTTPHHWRYTERAMEEAYGEKWRDHIQLHEIIGSGCIGQVYRGSIIAGASLQTDTTGIASNQQQLEQVVAVKVLHPGVQVDIDADLDLMRLTVRTIPYLPFNLLANLKWLNLEGVVEEFATLLKLQVDLRREAANLVRFSDNFRSDPAIQFPNLVSDFAPTDKVLVETFCEGIPVLQFCRQNQDNPQLLSALCTKAIRAVCKMIFLDNFVHGDLHPGNVLVSPDGKAFILLDVGIVSEYQQEDHNVIIDVLSAFIRRKGRVAGRRMIDDSNQKLLTSNSRDKAVDEERYIDKIEMLTIRASTKGYFMEHLGTYISYICDSAAKHHVMMNPSFVSAALAVKIQEGIALAMDPNTDIPSVAIPIIVESERRRFTNSAASSFHRIQKAILG